jgi:uncharacterized protein
MSGRALATVCLLILSNAFMTFAWYFHLKQRTWTPLVAIGISWLIAFPEYCLQVPANRLGHIAWGGSFSAAQLKVIQEAVTLVVFGVFTTTVLHERLRVNEMIALVLIFVAVLIAMSGRA